MIRSFYGGSERSSRGLCENRGLVLRKGSTISLTYKWQLLRLWGTAMDRVFDD